MHRSASLKSATSAILKNGTEVRIYKEVFKKKKSTSKKNRWYYIKADGIKGYVRADLVSRISYGHVSAVTKAKVKYYKGAGTKMKCLGSLPKGESITICLKARPVSSARGGSAKWYKIKRGSACFYVCSKKIKLTGRVYSASEPAHVYVNLPGGSVSDMTDAEFESYLKEQGFPSAYRKKLKALHKMHPDWSFAGYKTGIRWSDALKKQTKGGTSLISASYPKKYRSGSKQYEKGWYKANKAVVAYYMDPRNFLSEDRIFMFEDLSYKPAYHTSSVVSAVLAPSKLPGYGFTANLFTNAGAKHNISPVFLAARARQESGGGGKAINGKSKLGKVYNPFSIGAFGKGDPLYNGLLYARAKGWTTPAKAVDGGAKELAKNYISRGQYTVYYQRFNVRNGADKAGTHQYMTNITAPYSEAASTKKSYKSYGLLSRPLVFEIPIYSSMPKSTALP